MFSDMETRQRNKQDKHRRIFTTTTMRKGKRAVSQRAFISIIETGYASTDVVVERGENDVVSACQASVRRES